METIKLYDLTLQNGQSLLWHPKLERWTNNMGRRDIKYDLFLPNLHTIQLEVFDRSNPRYERKMREQWKGGGSHEMREEKRKEGRERREKWNVGLGSGKMIKMDIFVIFYCNRFDLSYTIWKCKNNSLSSVYSTINWEVLYVIMSNL